MAWPKSLAKPPSYVQLLVHGEPAFARRVPHEPAVACFHSPCAGERRPGHAAAGSPRALSYVYIHIYIYIEGIYLPILGYVTRDLEVPEVTARHLSAKETWSCSGTPAIPLGLLQRAV